MVTTMNCPYCNAYLSTYTTRCPECRSILPAERLMQEKNPSRKNLSQQERDAMLRDLTPESEVSLIHCLLVDSRIEGAIAASRSYQSIADLFSDLHRALTESGITISHADLRLLLAAMAAGRIMRFPDTDADAIKHLLLAVNRFMSGLSIAEGSIPDALNNPSRLFGDICAYSDPEKEEAGYYRDTVFLQNAYIAAATQTPLIQGVCDMHAHSFVATELFGAYAHMPESMQVIAKVKTADLILLPRFWFLFEDGYYLPRNMWFAFTGDAMARTDRKNDIADLAPALRIRLAVAPDNPDLVSDNAQPRFTYEDFCRLCRLSRDTVYFSESIFRKIDAFTERIRQHNSTYRLDNVLYRRMEVFSSVYMSAGGSESDALDTVLQLYLLPYAAVFVTDPIALEEAFTQCFADLDLPRSRDTLTHTAEPSV